jgi:biopolymer transport protein ExbD
MKKLILFTAITLIAVTTYRLLLPSNSNSNSTVTDNKEEKILEAPMLEDEALIFDEENLKLDDLEKSLEEEDKNLAPKEVVPEMVQEESVEVKDIMVETDIEEVKKSFSSKEGISPLIAVEIPKGSVSKLNIGDKISLPYMGTGEYEATITEKTTHKNGSVSVTGNLDDSGNKYSVVLTEGKNMSFGTVTTPNGSFEIEAKDGQGYVYSTDTIDQKWIDYTKGDTLESHQD